MGATQQEIMNDLKKVCPKLPTKEQKDCHSMQCDESLHQTCLVIDHVELLGRHHRLHDFGLLLQYPRLLARATCTSSRARVSTQDHVTRSYTKLVELSVRA